MISSFQRTTIFCRDAEQSLQLYRDILGFEVIEDKTISGPAAGALIQLPDCTLRMLLLATSKAAEPVIGLFQVTDAAVDSVQGPRDRICYGQTAIVLSTDDFEGVEKRLVDAGTDFLTKPLSYEKKVASAYSPAGIYREMIFYDPDGVLVSVLQILPLPTEEFNP